MYIPHVDPSGTLSSHPDVLIFVTHHVFLCRPCLDGTRNIPLDENLFTGFGETTLGPDEVLLSIDIPYTKPVR